MRKLLDHGHVKLIEAWGSDENVIRAARQSTDKGVQGWPEDERLLGYLYRHRHMTPFEMAGMIVEVQAPIFVFREWHRHRTQSYNEMSGRYVQLPNLTYVPSIERLSAGGQSTTNKQASGAAFDQPEVAREIIAKAHAEAREHYERLLAMGVAKELARAVLPVAQYSRMWASANLRNWLAFLDLRLPENAQWEIRQYACAVLDLVRGQFPRTAALFEE